MKLFKIFIGCVAIAVAFTGCKKDSPIGCGSYISKSYIMNIIQTDTIVGGYSYEHDALGISFSGKILDRHDAQFEIETARLGDISYNQRIAEWLNNEHYIHDSEVLSIEIITLNDFDAEHPAGSSVADLAVVSFLALNRSFIDDGYRNGFDRENYSPVSDYDLTREIGYYHVRSPKEG